MIKSKIYKIDKSQVRHDLKRDILTKDKNMTDEEKRKASAKAYTERKNAAKAVVAKWLESKPRLDDETKSAIEYLASVGTKTRSGINGQLRERFLKEKSIPLMTLFQDYEFGRPTMENKVRLFIKLPAEQRIWVAFEDGNYVLKGVGENAPRGWDGFMPANKEEL